LKLFAPLVFAAYHQRLATSVAFVASYESLAAADGACDGGWLAAAGAHGVATFYLPETGGAFKAEWRTAAALGTQMGAPLYHFVALDAGLFVCSHKSNLHFGIIH